MWAGPDLAEPRGIEPLSAVLETDMLPLHQGPSRQFKLMPRSDGLRRSRCNYLKKPVLLGVHSVEKATSASENRFVLATTR